MIIKRAGRIAKMQECKEGKMQEADAYKGIRFLDAHEKEHIFVGLAPSSRSASAVTARMQFSRSQPQKRDR